MGKQGPLSFKCFNHVGKGGGGYLTLNTITIAKMGYVSNRTCFPLSTNYLLPALQWGETHWAHTFCPPMPPTPASYFSTPPSWWWLFPRCIYPICPIFGPDSNTPKGTKMAQRQKKNFSETGYGVRIFWLWFSFRKIFHFFLCFL